MTGSSNLPGYRHVFHLTPPKGWMNDPNGFCFFQGKYHLFYQHNPHAPVWGKMHWGHATSTDLISWHHEEIALYPDTAGEAFLGCFSGSAIEKDGLLHLMYTGFSFTGQIQLMATSPDGLHFTKWKKPVIPSRNRPLHTFRRDFRDPKVFPHPQGKGYLCILASRWKKSGATGGQISLYRSDDLRDWEFAGILLESTVTDPGIFECPDFACIDGKDFLFASPMYLAPDERDAFENLHSVIAIPGRLDAESASFIPEEPGTRGFIELDGGTDFYASQTLKTPDGRTILVAWMQMWQRSMPTAGELWAGAMTIPRELRWENGRLYQKPIRELDIYRKPLFSRADVKIKDEYELSGDLPSFLDLDISLDLQQSSRVTLRLFESGDSFLKLSCDPAAGSLTLDRSRSAVKVASLDAREVRGPAIRTTQLGTRVGNLHLRIILDATSAEIFIGEGEAVMTTLFYPVPGKTGASIHCDGQVTMKHLDAREIIIPRP